MQDSILLQITLYSFFLAKDLCRDSIGTLILSPVLCMAQAFFSVVVAKKLVLSFCGEVVRKIVSLKIH